MSSTTKRVWSLVAVLTVVGAGLAMGALSFDPVPDRPLVLSWLALAGMFFLSERFVVTLRLGHQGVSSSVSDAPMTLGLLFASPAGLVLGAVIGQGAAYAIRGRRNPEKVAFNTAMVACTSALSVVLHRLLLGGGSPASPRGWLAVLGAILITQMLANVVIGMAVAVSAGRPVSEAPISLLANSQVVILMFTAVGIVAGHVLWIDTGSWSLVLVLGTAAWLMLLLYGSLGNRYESLRSLHAFVSRLAEGDTTGELHEIVLPDVAELFGADIVELRSPWGDDGDHRRRYEADTGRHRRMPLQDPADEVILPLLDDDDVVEFKAPAGTFHDRAVTGLAARISTEGNGAEGGVLLIARFVERRQLAAIDDRELLRTIALQSGNAASRWRLLTRLRLELADKEHRALHDDLTGLVNRTYFSQYVDRVAAGTGTRAADGARRGADGERDGGDHVAVYLLDLDRFKEINDTLGHHAGDVVLQEVARRLRALMRDADVVARFGGDEFAIAGAGVGDVTQAVAVAERIRAAFHRPIVHEGISLEIGASIGIAMSPDHGTDAATLIQRADVALYTAKREATGYEMYVAADDHHTPRRLQLAADLRVAVAAGAIDVHYQPKVDIASGRVTGFEALARWTHPEMGFVSPMEFVDIAEQTGQIRDLTAHVLASAVASVAVWREQFPNLSVAVNVSPRALADQRLPDRLRTALRQNHLPASAVVLEVTESTVMTDSERTNAIVLELEKIGVGLSIDDYGTGYSSLQNLQRLNFDELKIDRTFVDTMLTDAQNATIVRSTVDLAHSLGLTCVAEGVEDLETWQALRKLGCDVLQGYYTGKPMPAAEVAGWLRDCGGTVPEVEGLLRAVGD